MSTPIEGSTKVDVDYDELSREIEARYYGSDGLRRVIDVQAYLDDVQGVLVTGEISYDWVSSSPSGFSEEGHESFGFTYNRQTKQFVD